MSVSLILLIVKPRRKSNNYNKLEMPNLLQIDHYSQANDRKKIKDNVLCNVNILIRLILLHINMFWY